MIDSNLQSLTFIQRSLLFFRELPHLMNKIYFWYSLIYMISRTLATLHLASCIYDESRKPIIFLRGVPSFAWTLEV